jgi:O-antigen ligase
LAFALVVAFPFLWFGRRLANARWLQLLMLSLAGGCVVAIILSRSRGGALALAATFMMVAIRSKYKLGIVVLLMLLCAPALFIAGSSYMDRMSTLAALSEDGSQEMESSMMGRLRLNKAGIQVWLDNFWFGVGYGGDNWVLASRPILGERSVHHVHNNYVQWGVDAGVFAFMIVCGQLLMSFLLFRRTRARIQITHPGMEVYALIGEAAVAGFTVGSTFLSRTDYDLFYYLIMFAAAWWNIERTQLAETTATVPADVSSRPAAQGQPAPFPLLGPVPQPAVVGPADLAMRKSREWKLIFLFFESITFRLTLDGAQPGLVYGVVIDVRVLSASLSIPVK